MRAILWTGVVIATTTSFVHAQVTPAPPRQGPGVPLQQSRVPQMNPVARQVPTSNPLTMVPGVNGVPGSTVYTPQRYYPRVGNTYVINNYNNGTNNPFGVPSTGFQGGFASGQFYSNLGGPAPSNPFVGNVPPIQQTWPRATGVGVNGQPWNFPFQYYNFNNTPQFPQIVNAPVVGQSNGLFPPQPNPFGDPRQNPFGVQVVPGLNGFGNPIR